MFAARTGQLSFRVTYGPVLTIRCQTGLALALDDLKTHLECHFSLERDSAIVLKDSVLNVDATQVNGYEVGQCINLLLAVADMLRQMDVPCNWAWAWGIPTRRLLPSLGDAPACLNPQGLLRQLLRMEDESNAQSPFLDSVFLNHFESLPCDRADRVLKLATDIETEMTAPQRLQLGERIIAALLASGLTQRARDAAKSLFAVCPENDLSTHSRSRPPRSRHGNCAQDGCFCARHRIGSGPKARMWKRWKRRSEPWPSPVGG